MLELLEWVQFLLQASTYTWHISYPTSSSLIHEKKKKKQTQEIETCYQTEGKKKEKLEGNEEKRVSLWENEKPIKF